MEFHSVGHMPNRNHKAVTFSDGVGIGDADSKFVSEQHPRWVSPKGPAKESTTEDLSQGLCDPTNLKIIQLEPQLKPNFFEAANSISFRS